jgi:hypothetical protein
MMKSRREVLRLMVIGAGALPVLGLSACGGGGGPSCNDTSGLAASDADFRRAQGYVERSTREGRNCSGCNFYTAAAPEACGSCSVVRGPINPGGYCNLWVQRPT